MCLGQNIPVLHNESVESSSTYIDGNNYQKDLLLYVDMLQATHPYYADAKHCAQLDKQARKLYKECGGTKLTLSSDAHFLAQQEDYYNLQEDFIKVIKEAGFNELYYFIKRKQHKFMI